MVYRSPRGRLNAHLLCSEVVGDKVLLQLLVGVVDAELLQVVPLEALEAVHVQQAWGAPRGTRQVTGQCTNAVSGPTELCVTAGCCTYEIAPGGVVRTDASVYERGQPLKQAGKQEKDRRKLRQKQRQDNGF